MGDRIIIMVLLLLFILLITAMMTIMANIYILSTPSLSIFIILKRMPRMINCRRQRRRGRHCGLTNNYYSHIVDIIPFLMILVLLTKMMTCFDILPSTNFQQNFFDQFRWNRMTENLTDLNFYIRRNKVCFYNKLQEGINIRVVKGLQ